MVSYKPLSRYCLEHEISKAQCRQICGIFHKTETKINRNEEVSMSVLNKICAGLGLSYGDIIEYVEVDKEMENENG